MLMHLIGKILIDKGKWENGLTNLGPEGEQ